jgi:hypothetical protein
LIAVSALTLLVGATAAVPQGQGGRQFWQRLGLDATDIKMLDSAKAVVREHPTADKAEIVMFGAVHIGAPPEAFVQSYTEVRKRVNGDSYLAAGYFGKPPTVDDLAELVFDGEDILALMECRPGACDVQLPAEAIERFRTGINWSAPDARDKATAELRRMALEALVAYQKGGNRALGVYRDHDQPTAVESVYRTVLSRAENLPRLQPEFHRYLLEYPTGKPAAETYEFYYWENVKFGLKPTFRMNHVIIYRPKDKPAASWAIADKQLYSNHYFQTAIDLWFCVLDVERPSRPGFYLLNFKGSRQAGLTGFKGRIVRPVVISKTKAAMESALLRLKETTERSAR